MIRVSNILVQGGPMSVMRSPLVFIMVLLIRCLRNTCGAHSHRITWTMLGSWVAPGCYKLEELMIQAETIRDRVMDR
ncbi:hypothetical protein B0T26DRAFT_713668, partial [Lasiosphaeria miniovina]